MGLQVSSIRYFKTNRGLGYQAKTNHEGVEIHNDGQGGETYLFGQYSLIKPFDNLKVNGRENEWALEELLNLYERSQGIIC